MKLYYTPGACSLTVHIVMNEIDLPAEYIAVDLKTKKLANGEDFNVINPKSEIPVLQLDNGDILTENAVILQYLADQYKRIDLLPEVGDIQRYHVLEWVNFITTDIHKGFAPLFNPAVSHEMRESIFIPYLQKKFALLDARLADRKFIMGDHFTLPDAYAFVMLTWLHVMKIPVTSWQNLSRFYETMKARPAVQKSLHEEGLKY